MSDSWDNEDFKNRLQEIQEKGDCIIVPGSHCDSLTGMPTRDYLVRCDVALSLKTEMKNFKCFVFSGADRGLKEYLEIDPTATEGGQGVRYAVSRGEHTKNCVMEPFALETVGNLVLTTPILLERGLRYPVFLTQAHHLFRLQIMWRHWFRSSGISPLPYIVQDSNPQLADDRVKKEMRSTLLNEDRGFGFAHKFCDGTLPLHSASNEAEVQWVLEVAIRWMFEHSTDLVTGKLRYPEKYDVDQLLVDLKIKKDNV